jgi:MFS transporter, OFA family, oxalate/formate antiporter
VFAVFPEETKKQVALLMGSERVETAASLSALFMYNSCLAIFLTYGVFFSSVRAEFGAPASSTALVFAVFAALYSVSSLLMGFFTDAYGASKTIFLGGALMAIGLVLSSFAPSIPALIVTYGVVAGSGTGSMWLPTSFSVFEKFEPARVRDVTGLVSAGTAFGSLFFAPLEAYLISSFGWRDAFLALGVIVFVFALAASFASKRGKQKRKEENKINTATFEQSLEARRINLSPAFQKIRSGTGFWSLYAYYMIGNAFSRTLVMVFAVPMLQERGFGVFVGSIALGLIGGGSMIGRFFTRFQSISEEKIAAFSFLLQGISSFGLFYSNSLLTIYVTAFIFGIGYGGYIPQFALIIRKRYGLALYGGIFGILLTSYGVGAFVGPWFGGIDLSISGSYTLIFYLAGFSSILIGLHQLISFQISKKKDAGAGATVREITPA